MATNKSSKMPPFEVLLQDSLERHINAELQKIFDERVKEMQAEMLLAKDRLVAGAALTIMSHIRVEDLGREFRIIVEKRNQ